MADLFLSLPVELYSSIPTTPNSSVKRLRDQGDGTVAEVVSTAPGPNQAVDGIMFLAGSGDLALAVAGNLSLTLQNPTGSGKSLYVTRLDVFATATGFAELLVNPTAGLPTVQRRVNNVNFGSSTVSVAVVMADTSTTTAMSGGIDSGVSVGAGVNALATYELPPMVIPPGVTLGLALPFTGAASASVNLYWYEQ